MEHKEQKDSFISKILIFFIDSMFPIFKLLKINSLITLCEETLDKEMFEGSNKSKEIKQPYDWFEKQKRRNLILGITSPLPFIFSIIAAFSILSGNEYLGKGYSAVKKEVFRFKFKEASRKIEIIKKLSPNMIDDIHLSKNIVLIGFVISLISGARIIYLNPILIGTKRLREGLINEGLIKKDDDKAVVFATKIGVLVDISGHTAREIADADRVWIPLNLMINRDWAENPKKRSIVFFQIKFSLRKGDEYKYNDKDELKRLGIL